MEKKNIKGLAMKMEINLEYQNLEQVKSEIKIEGNAATINILGVKPEIVKNFSKRDVNKCTVCEKDFKT